MFRRTRPSSVAWEEPAPPPRAVALAFAGMAGTISLVVGVLMWAGSAASQPRTFDSGAAAVAPAARLGAVSVPADEAPLSPVPLPPAPVASPSSMPATERSFAPQTAAASTIATTAPAPPSAPVTAPAASPPASTTTSTTTTSTTAATTTTSTLVSTVPTTTATTITPPSTTTTVTTTTTTAGTTAPPAGTTLWAAVRADPALSRFADFVEQGGMAASLEVDAPHTLIAPDDAAIAAYASTPAGAAELASPQAIRAFVMRHLVLDELDAAALFALDGVQVASGEWVPIDGAARAVGGAELLSVDVRADNGVLHVAAGVVLAGTTA